MRTKQEQEHFDKYDKIVKDHRLENFDVGFSKKNLADAYSENKHLNTIPLKYWDSETFRLNIRCTLSEKVCVLKHIAIHYIIKIN